MYKNKTLWLITKHFETWLAQRFPRHSVFYVCFAISAQVSLTYYAFYIILYSKFNQLLCHVIMIVSSYTV